VTRILLIEDNADAREALRALLELDGYEVHAAADGTEGLELARTKMPEVALIDIGLPGFDGYEVQRARRSCARTRSGIRRAPGQAGRPG